MAEDAVAPDAGDGPEEAARPGALELVRKVLLTRHIARHVAVSLTVVAVFVAAGVIRVDGWLLESAVAVHLLGLTMALGALIVIDWTGLAWIAGVRTIREALRTAEAATPLVWTGLVLLLASGLFLAPDLTTLLPWIKMAAVLVLINNGVVVSHVQRELGRLPGHLKHESVPGGARLRMMGSVLVSHLGWWTAAVIGVVTMLARR